MAAGDGLVSMTPTSISYSGTSATINTNGGVDFTAVTSLSLNGVFTSNHDNYLVVIQLQGDVTGAYLQARLRAAGTDNSTASSYVRQRLDANNITIQSDRTTSDLTHILRELSAITSGCDLYVYGPALAQPTAMRSVTVGGRNGGWISDLATSHNQSVSYDGFTIYPTSGNVTGNVHVFGYEE